MRRQLKTLGWTVCVRDVYFLQDVEFLQYNQYKQPTIAVCWEDGDIALSLRPQHSIEVLMEAWQQGDGSLVDATFHKDFKESKRDVSSRETGDFRPASTVQASEMYGMRVIQPYGLLTETEYATLLCDVPASIAKKPIQLPTMQPGVMSTHYLVDLAGISPEVVSGMRRVELYYDTQAQHIKTFLAAANQIHQEQGQHSFFSVVSEAHNLRPDGLKPRSNPPDTLEKLREEHEKAQAMRAAMRAEAAASAAAADTPMQPCDEGDAEEEAMSRKRTAGLGQLSGAQVPSKRARTKKAVLEQAAESKLSKPTPAVLPNLKTGPAGASKPIVKQVETLTTDQRSDTTAGKSKNSALMLRLDANMQQVAKAHLKMCPTGCIKSLEILQPLKFLTQYSKQLSNSLNGVRGSESETSDATLPLNLLNRDLVLSSYLLIWSEARRILDSMMKGPDSEETDMLKDRIADCEDCAVLAVNAVDVMDFEDLAFRVNRTKSLWPSYPRVLQIEVTCRRIQQEMVISYDAVSNDVDKALDHVQNFCDAFLLQEVLDVTETEPPSWSGLETSLFPCVAWMLWDIEGEDDKGGAAEPVDEADAADPVEEQADAETPTASPAQARIFNSGSW